MQPQQQQPSLQPPLQLPPGQPSAAFVRQAADGLLAACAAGAQAATRAFLPCDQLREVIKRAKARLKLEPTLLEISPSKLGNLPVTVVGDLHGQFTDLMHMLDTYGHPCAERLFVFNGDFVDRGSWGVEVLACLLLWKLALPERVYLLRGNHESTYCTTCYGFAAELAGKYGGSDGKKLYRACQHLFAALPLACCIEGATLVLHGGLFRAPPPPTPRRGRGRAASQDPAQPGGPGEQQPAHEPQLPLGCLDDLRRASKGSLDPDPTEHASDVIACDVTWSDPTSRATFQHHHARGMGTLFGPCQTEIFLASNELKLIIRSHEGPDARAKRAAAGDPMPCILSGYAEDHTTPLGKLVTVFSAPDYPQFLKDGKERCHNQGAILELSAPDYATPVVRRYDAQPRPEAAVYYQEPSSPQGSESSDEPSSGSQRSAHSMGSGGAAASAADGGGSEADSWRGAGRGGAGAAATQTDCAAGGGQGCSLAAAAVAGAARSHAASSSSPAAEAAQLAAGKLGERFKKARLAAHR